MPLSSFNQTFSGRLNVAQATAALAAHCAPPHPAPVARQTGIRLHQSSLPAAECAPHPAAHAPRRLFQAGHSKAVSQIMQRRHHLTHAMPIGIRLDHRKRLPAGRAAFCHGIVLSDRRQIDGGNKRAHGGNVLSKRAASFTHCHAPFYTLYYSFYYLLVAWQLPRPRLTLRCHVRRPLQTVWTPVLYQRQQAEELHVCHEWIAVLGGPYQAAVFNPLMVAPPAASPINMWQGSKSEP